MLTIWAFHNTENKHTLNHEEDCKKRFCTCLREHATNVVNFEKKIVTINKRRAKIISRRKSMSYLWKKNLKKVC